MKKLLLLVSAIALASACSSETVYSVEQLVKDKALYEKVQLKCRNNDYSESSENCLNLQEASDKIKASGGDFPEWG